MSKCKKVKRVWVEPIESCYFIPEYGYMYLEGDDDGCLYVWDVWLFPHETHNWVYAGKYMAHPTEHFSNVAPITKMEMILICGTVEASSSSRVFNSTLESVVL